jgi:hypothetical protein
LSALTTSSPDPPLALSFPLLMDAESEF